MSRFIAHIRVVPNVRCDVQTVERHCRNVAKYASERLKRVGLASAGYLAGLIHDMGKFTELFCTYIKRVAAGQQVARGSVNHTFAAVIFLLERYHGETRLTERDVACEILAFAAGAHHGQFDCIDPSGKSGFIHRLAADRTEIKYEEAKVHFITECAGYEELDRLFETACTEIKTFTDRILSHDVSESELDFSLALLCRLLLSAVIDADRQDTAEFMEGVVFPTWGKDLSGLWRERSAFMEEKLKSLKGCNTAICTARQTISNICKDHASRNAAGIFRLGVPTGSGKTLASLRYALRNAEIFHKSRLIFVIPLLTIIEQNADVLREYIGDSSLVLEHHSDIVQAQKNSDEPSGELDKRELLTEDWHAPVIITTMVQFLNTLFLGKNTSVRRMQALCNSVIVIDEIQSVPGNMLSLVNAALNFLAYNCGATVMLCSATQPSLNKVPHPIRYTEPADIVQYSSNLWAPFRRTELRDARRPYGYTFEELTDFALEQMTKVDSLLVICNTKAEARRLYSLLGDSQEKNFELFHLSAAMCKAHRQRVLNAINSRLSQKKRKKVVCVATQLVEAGVDFSFTCVIRLLAGMENAAQAAGRCNRNGESDRLCPVYLVNLQNESLRNLPDIRSEQQAAISFLALYAQNFKRFGGDPLSNASIRCYYDQLFRSRHIGYMDFMLPKQHTTIYELLSKNESFRNRSGGRYDGKYYIRQAFKTAGDNFQVFPELTKEVIVPYDKAARELIADLYSEQAKWDITFLKKKLKEAKSYTVSIFEYQEKKLQKMDALHPGPENAFLTLAEGFYSQEIGLDETGCSPSPNQGGNFS
jgi:CRISPR-associated endonuclease/helicase Cas3